MILFTLLSIFYVLILEDIHHYFFLINFISILFLLLFYILGNYFKNFN
jgi:hypothetical protein